SGARRHRAGRISSAVPFRWAEAFILARPAFLTDERHELDGAEVLLLVAALIEATDAKERLKARRCADGKNEPPSDREPFAKRAGDFGASCRDHDRIERSVLGDSDGSIAHEDVDVLVAEHAKADLGLARQGLDPLDREHVESDATCDRRC